MPPNLSFSGLSDATTNGSQLGSWGVGLQQQSLSQPNIAPVNSGLPSVNVASPTSGATAPAAQTGQGPGFFSKDGGAGLILGGVQVLGNLWSSYQAHKIAKDQLSFAREQFDTNLANQEQTYNTALEDRIRSRHFSEGRDASETDSYLAANRL